MATYEINAQPMPQSKKVIFHYDTHCKGKSGYYYLREDSPQIFKSYSELRLSRTKYVENDWGKLFYPGNPNSANDATGNPNDEWDSITFKKGLKKGTTIELWSDKNKRGRRLTFLVTKTLDYDFCIHDLDNAYKNDIKNHNDKFSYLKVTSSEKPDDVDMHDAASSLYVKFYY